MSTRDKMPLSRRRFLAASVAAATLAGLGPARAAAGPPVYVDGLSFLPEDPADLARSALGAFICDVSDYETVVDAQGQKSYPRTFEKCDLSIREAAARIAREFPDLMVARTAADLADGRAKAIFQFQGCDAIGDDLSRMRHFHDLSLRVLQLTHNESNAHATAYVDEGTGVGLSALGREGVGEMNRVGLIPDVSHGSEPTALDTVAVSSKPVILSHSACRALLNHPRAATDRMIRAVADSGGVFGVFMMSFWLTDDPVPTTEHYVAHIRHAVNVAGLDAVGIANDYAMAGLSASAGRPFDNAADMQGYQTWWQGYRRRGVPGFGPDPLHAVIPELNNIDRMKLIHQALLKGGFGAAAAEKIVGGNWMTFLRDNLG